MKFSIVLVIVFIAAFTFGCASQPNVSTSNTNANVTVANANANANTSKSEAPTTTADSTSVGSLATPTEAYRTAYALREKKDIAGLKKVLSKEVIEFLEVVADADKKKLDDVIAEMFVKPQAKTPETRNEKIKGDRASLEYLDEKGEWSVMDFVTEDGVWKMSFPDKGDFKVETGPPGNKATKP